MLFLAHPAPVNLVISEPMHSGSILGCSSDFWFCGINLWSLALPFCFVKLPKNSPLGDTKLLCVYGALYSFLFSDSWRNHLRTSSIMDSVISRVASSRQKSRRPFLTGHFG